MVAVNQDVDGTEGTGSRNNHEEAVIQKSNGAEGTGSRNNDEPIRTFIRDARGAEGTGSRNNDEPIEAVIQDAHGTEGTGFRNNDEPIEAFIEEALGAEDTGSRNNDESIEAINQDAHGAKDTGSMNNYEPLETVIQDAHGAESAGSRNNDESIEAVLQESLGAEDTLSRNSDESMEATNAEAHGAEDTASLNNNGPIETVIFGAEDNGSRNFDGPIEAVIQGAHEPTVRIQTESAVCDDKTTSSFRAEQGNVYAQELRLMAEDAKRIEDQNEALLAQEPKMRVGDEASQTYNREMESGAEMVTDHEAAEPEVPSNDNTLPQAEHEARSPIPRETSNHLLESKSTTTQDGAMVERGDLMVRSSSDVDADAVDLENSAQNQSELTLTEEFGYRSRAEPRRVQQMDDQSVSPSLASLANAEQSNRFGRRTMLTSRLSSEDRRRMSMPDQSVSLASRAFQGTFIDIVVNRTKMPASSRSNIGSEVSTPFPLSAEQDRLDQNSTSQRTKVGRINNSDKSTNRQKDLPGQAIPPNSQMNYRSLALSPLPRRKKVWKQIPTAGGFKLVQVEEEIAEIADSNLLEMDVKTSIEKVKTTIAADKELMDRNSTLLAPHPTVEENEETNTTDKEVMDADSTHVEGQNGADEQRLREDEQGTAMDMNGNTIELPVIDIAEENRQREEEERVAKQEKAKAAVARIKAFFEEKGPSNDAIVDQWLNYEKRWGALPSAGNALNEEEKEMIKKKAKYYFARDIVPKDLTKNIPPVEGTAQERQLLPSDPSQASTGSQKRTPFFAQRTEPKSKGSPQSS